MLVRNRKKGKGNTTKKARPCAEDGSAPGKVPNKTNKENNRLHKDQRSHFPNLAGRGTGVTMILEDLTRFLRRLRACLFFCTQNPENVFAFVNDDTV